ncbi:hypothetical protein [Methanolapillus ohkumae]|uniref:Uncharacterized protein n=1 Tax=Methanolapillus ohkumae TaxID=3028298 RepID=A0AA96V6U4_9EURY|nr:hypothetical protein MsAm2_14170 [Methanosarcinaceae archaeon Am2]
MKSKMKSKTKSIFKTILFLLFILICWISFTLPAAANENPNPAPYVPLGLMVTDSDSITVSTVVVNEYDFVHEMKFDFLKLADERYNLSELYHLYFYKIHLKKQLKELNSSCTDDDLKNLGYTDAGIYVIRNLDKNPDLSKAAAECTIQIRIDRVSGYFGKLEESSAVVHYEYFWNTKPISGLTKEGIVKMQGWEPSPYSFVGDRKYNLIPPANYSNESWEVFDQNLRFSGNRGPIVLVHTLDASGEYYESGKGSYRIYTTRIMPKDGGINFFISYYHQPDAEQEKPYLLEF